ncbi:MAG: xanthine dehydrogenase family protein subunit M [Bacillota bacterium]|nr:xanthine dehydrogenase family protein subunit M [Bacillota bacterium]
MKPPRFAYAVPESLEEALGLLREYGGDAKVLAGGQSLMPMLNLRLLRPSVLVDINRLPGEDRIEEEDGFLRIGALVRHRQAVRSPLVRRRLPLLAEAVGQIGHPQIRNRGTLCGSVAHADPAAEIPAVLAALGGEVLLRSAAGARSVPAEQFFLGFLTTALGPEEMVEAIRLPVAPPGSGSAFLEFNRRAGDFAIVGVAAQLTLDERGRIRAAGLALTGVGGAPFRAGSAEALLRGEAPSEALFARAAERVAEEVDPEADIYASAEYRRHLAGVLTRRALAAAWRRATSGNREGEA